MVWQQITKFPNYLNQLQYVGITIQDNPFNTWEPIAISHQEKNVPLLLDGTNIFSDNHSDTVRIRQLPTYRADP
jgi:hypothetical protein